jgi:hypothetical protein
VAGGFDDDRLGPVDLGSVGPNRFRSSMGLHLYSSM